MAAFQRLGRTLAVAVVSTSALIAPAAGQAGDDTPGTVDGSTDTRGTTDSGVAQLPVLTLEPDRGLPGAQVSATGGGFARCSSNDDVGPESLSLIWDGMPLQIVDLDGAGTFSTTFEVPSSASLDTSYAVAARCAGHGDQEASTDFAVIAPLAVPGTGDVTENQDPPAGTRIEPGAAEDDGPAAEEPALVVVPDLVDGTVDEARAALAAVGLALANEPDGGSTVVGQAPAAGTPVPAGTGVTITVDPAPVPAPSPPPSASGLRCGSSPRR